MGSDLEVHSWCLSQDLYVHPGGGGTNGQLGNGFQLVKTDPQSLHRGRRDDIGEGVAAVDVSCSPYSSQPDGDLGAVITGCPRVCLYLGDCPDLIFESHGCKSTEIVSSIEMMC